MSGESLDARWCTAHCRIFRCCHHLLGNVIRLLLVDVAGFADGKFCLDSRFALARGAPAATGADGFALEGERGSYGRVKNRRIFFRATAVGKKMSCAIVCRFCRSKSSHSGSAQFRRHLHGSTFGLILAEAVRAIVVAGLFRSRSAVEIDPYIGFDRIEIATLGQLFRIV